MSQEGQPSGRRIARNAAHNALSWIVTVGLALLVTPYLIDRLGLTGYGVYAILVSFVGYFTVVDLGLGQAITQHVAAHGGSAEGRAQLGSAINSALAVQLLIGGVGATCIAVSADALTNLINVPPELSTEARSGLLAVAVGFGCTALNAGLTAALMGLQRYDLTTRVTVITNILLNVSLVVVLETGGGLASVVYASSAVPAVSAAWNFVLVKRELPTWRASLRIDPSLLRRLFSFSGYVFVSKLASAFNNYVVRFVVGAVLGPAAVTAYVVPLRAVTAVGGLLSAISTVLLPVSSTLVGRSSLAAARQLYFKGSRYVLALAFPLYLCGAVFSREILTLWVGEELASIAWPVQSILAFAYLLSATTMVPTNVALGLGRSKDVARFSGILFGVGAAFVYPLTDTLGIIGTALSILIAQVVAIWFLRYVTKRIMEVRMRDFLRDVASIHILGLLVAAGWYVALPGFQASYSLAVVSVTAFVAVYLTMYAISGWLPLAEIRRVFNR